MLAARKGELTVTNEADKTGQHRTIANLWVRAAHDLRQPVQAALLLTRLLHDASDPAELRCTARQIEAVLGSLHKMLEVLTLLSRVEAGLQIVPICTSQLGDVLATTIRETGEIAAKRGIPLRFRNIRGKVRTNPTLLAAATRSLLLNAIKFGDGEEIVACCRRRRNQVNLEVHFRGASLDSASERNAFVELSSRHNSTTAPELGLGLGLLEHLCRLLGHSMHRTKLSGDRQFLTVGLPLADTSL